MKRWHTSFSSILILLFLCFLTSIFPALGQSQTKVFDDVWKTVNDNFYRKDFKGVDWEAMRQKYEPKVVKTQSSHDAAIVINQMLSELQSSHTHFYTKDEIAYYQLLGIFRDFRGSDFQKQLKKLFPGGKIEYSGIGMTTQDIDGKTFIRTILNGSPAAKSGLKVGDQVLGVDGRPYQAIQSFEGKAGQKVTVSIQRTSDSQSREEITVTPKVLDTTKMFLDAQEESTRVINRDGKKIGYIHIWSYAGDQYQEHLEEQLTEGRLKDADGLILDLREGWGGARSLGYFNLFNARGPSTTIIQRDGSQMTTNYQWKKPVVLLVNEGSRSAKEMLAYGFQKYGMGPVVGSKTAGAVLAGRPFLMQEGSLLYVAVSDVQVDGERLEGKGVTPDISVPFLLAYAQGADPQKEKALEVVLAAVKKGTVGLFQVDELHSK